MMFEYFNSFYCWCDLNPEKVSPNITAVYFALLNRANKSGWKDKFAIILIDLQETTGINSRTTMLKTLSLLEEYGFVKTISSTQNQYKNRVICLPFNGNQMESTRKPNGKHVETTWTHNKTIKTIEDYKDLKETVDEKSTSFKKLNEVQFKETIREHLETFGRDMCNDFYNYWSEKNPQGKMKFQLQKTWEVKKRLLKWQSNNFGNKTPQHQINEQPSPIKNAIV